MTLIELCTRPCQFTEGKTKLTLTQIVKRYKLNKSNENDGKHLIEVIVTNNSLQETQQWKYRTKQRCDNDEKTKDIIIDILSSKSSDYKNINDYIANILDSKKLEQLPNILIICYHKKRVCDDLIKLLSTFVGRHTLILPEIEVQTKVVFIISFDEPDANIGVTNKFLKKALPFINKQLDDGDYKIRSITFITATATEKLLKVLQKNGIYKLLNATYHRSTNFSDECLDYRAFKDHTCIYNDNQTMNPLVYIKEVFKTIKERNDNRKVIFAPGHTFTEADGVGSHKEIMKFFHKENYVVLVLNGKQKSFISPNGDEIHIGDFNESNNIDGELRETLKVWFEKNPNKNLAITGYSVIQRGVTFNTDGFNFTDMILSNYHASNVGSLVQIGGRGSGGRQYVGIMFVHCTRTIEKKINHENERLINLCKVCPEYLNKTDFSDNENGIPVKVIFHDINIHNELVELRENGRRNYKVAFHEVIKRGYRDNKIELVDNNNIHKMNIYDRVINNVKMYKNNDAHPESRRFKQFNNAHEKNNTPSQSGNQEQYNIDFCKDRYEYNGFVNEKHIAWITFKVHTDE